MAEETVQIKAHTYPHFLREDKGVGCGSGGALNTLATFRQRPLMQGKRPNKHEATLLRGWPGREGTGRRGPHGLALAVLARGQGTTSTGPGRPGQRRRETEGTGPAINRQPGGPGPYRESSETKLSSLTPPTRGKHGVTHDGAANRISL